MDQKQLLAQIGENISKYRREAGLTQAELASKINVGVPFISRVERGEKSMKLYTLYKLADALGVSCDMLMYPVSSSVYINEIIHLLQGRSTTYLAGIVEMVRSCEKIFVALSDMPLQETGEEDASHAS